MKKYKFIDKETFEKWSKSHLKLMKLYNPLYTLFDDKQTLKVEFNLPFGKIEPETDKSITEEIESSGEWKWYAQGVDLTTKRRDICFERIQQCQPSKGA